MKAFSVSAYLRLARWPNALLAVAGVFVGAFYLPRPIPVLSDPGAVGRLLVVGAAAVLLTLTANAWNDAADAEIDRVAHPERPVPAGLIPIERARLTALGAAALAIGLAAGASWTLGLLTVAVVALMLAYSPWLKRTLLVGNLAAALLASLPFLYGAWAVNDAQKGLFLVVWAFPLHFAREIAKDIDDAPADDGHRHTVPLEWGPFAARTLAIGAILCFLAPLPLLSGWRGLALAMLPAVGCVIAGAAFIFRDRTGAPRLLKIGMGFAMLALVAATAIPALRPPTH